MCVMKSSGLNLKIVPLPSSYNSFMYSFITKERDKITHSGLWSHIEIKISFSHLYFVADGHDGIAQN